MFSISPFAEHERHPGDRHYRMGLVHFPTRKGVPWLSTVVNRDHVIRLISLVSLAGPREAAVSNLVTCHIWPRLRASTAMKGGEGQSGEKLETYL